jgi:hypothetical protein
MSANFCLLIPSKIFQVDKDFIDHLKIWLVSQEIRLPNSSLISIENFSDRPDVHLLLTPSLAQKYHILDLGFESFHEKQLEEFLNWIFSIYPYGKVGLLKYWLNNKKQFPSITTQELTISNSVDMAQLPLDKIIFVERKVYDNKYRFNDIEQFRRNNWLS